MALAGAAIAESQQPGRHYAHPAVMTTFSLVITLALTARRRAPVVVGLILAVLGLVEAVTVNTPASAVLFVAYLVSIYTVVAYREPRVWGPFLALTMVTSTVTEMRDPATRSVVEALPTFAIIAAVVLLALVVRRSRQRADQMRRLAHQLAQAQALADMMARAQERLRIAREMHDVLARSVSVMVLQTGAARMSLHERESRVSGLLLAVEDVGRDALAELRAILGVLRSGSTPDAGIDEALRQVVEQVQAAGLSVEVHSDLDVDSLGADVGLAVLRVVQEGLTNALRHARGSGAEVRMTAVGEGLRVVVTNTAHQPGLPERAFPSSGLGLVGLTERISRLGGQVTSTALPGGGWELRASFPQSVPIGPVSAAG